MISPHTECCYAFNGPSIDSLPGGIFIATAGCIELITNRVSRGKQEQISIVLGSII